MLMSVDLFSPLQNRCWGKNIVLYLIIMYNKFRKLLMKVRSSNATFAIFFPQIVSKHYKVFLPSEYTYKLEKFQSKYVNG